MIPLSDIHVLLPAYNEAAQLPAVVRALHREGFTRVVVINDGSTDETAAVAATLGVRIVSHLVNRGAGAAAQTGIELARRMNWPYIAFMDSDGQHDPRDILRLLAKMNDSRCDLVIGSRFMNREDEIPRSRIFFNFIANRMTNFICKKNYSDSQSGLRLLNRRAIMRLDLHLDGFGFCSEMIIKAERSHLRIQETPTTVVYTDYSISKGQDFQVGIVTAFNILWNTVFK